MTQKHQRALLQALEESQENGTLVTVMASFADDPAALVDVSVEEVEPDRWRFRIRQRNSDIGKWFYVGHVQAVKFADGRTPDNPDGEAYWKSIEDRRSKSAAWRRELTDEYRAPDTYAAPYELWFKINDKGTRIPGPPGSKREVEMHIVHGRNSECTAIYVKDLTAARRVSALVGNSYWDLAHAWLISEFVWIDWIRNNPKGNLVSQGVLTQIFRWSQMTKPDSVNLFLAKTWKSKICFKASIDHLQDDEIQQLSDAKLCVPAATAPLATLLNAAPFSDTRAFLKKQGIKVTTRNDAVARLKEIATNSPADVEAYLRTAPGFGGRHCFLPPCGMTLEAWQDFRNWHNLMIFEFNEFIWRELSNVRA